VESLRAINKDIEVIPAHIWTPWFSVFGSKSGFNTLKECFQDQVKHIHALETGLSSDPPMNWRLSQLDKYNLVSSSDLHSFWPWRMGREATIFDMNELSYPNILNAIRTGDGIHGTIEVDPNYGKYHYDGHRNCNIVMSPDESKKHNNICPVCRRPLTIGVQNRIEELADREEGYRPADAKEFYSLIPLSDLISLIKGKAVATKSVWDEYNRIVNSARNELEVLMNMTLDQLSEVTDERIAQAVVDYRDGKIKVSPGYDGEYGVPILNGIKKKKEADPLDGKSHPQKGLSDFF